MQDGAVVAVKGNVEENGQRYTAVVDNQKNSGVLIGAGTFTLADGELATNEDTFIEWPNSYALKIKLK